MNDAVPSPNDPDDPAGRLRAAIAGDEFCLFCQAIVSLGSNSKRRHFYEILLRSQEEEQGFAQPGSFFSVAEEFNMLPELDRWVLRTLLAWVSGDPSRQRAGYSINLAPQTVADPGFGSYVAEQLSVTGMPGAILCFEVPESDALAAPAATAHLVKQLKAAGCRFALSGFGRDRASFDLLKTLPVDLIKIDGDIIRTMLRDPAEMARVKAIHHLAHTLRMRTIAEFVEDNQTITKLKELGVNYAQGFGVARPIALQDVPL